MSDIKIGDFVEDVSGSVGVVTGVTYCLGTAFLYVSYSSGPARVFTSVRVPLSAVRKTISKVVPLGDSYSRKELDEVMQKPLIKAGDVVQLKSGGPIMTVAIPSIADDELRDCVRAIWFDEKTGEYMSDDLPAFTLVKIDSQA